MTAMMKVKLLQPEDEKRWDAFVDADSQGTIFHKIAWKRVIGATFPYKPYYLLAERGEALCGVLPLFHVHTMFSGNALISTPFAVYGGILAKDREAESALFEATKEQARQLSANYIELRERYSKPNEQLQTRDSLYVTFLRRIEKSAEANFKLLPREARRLVRKSEAGGFSGQRSRRVGDLKTFYHIYAASVRHLGTPVFPYYMFENCLNFLQDDADLLLIYHQDKPVAGVLSFYYRDIVLPYYGGALPEERAPSPNNYMYWHLMREAGARGYAWFDFGRSKSDTGAYNFKRHMGFEPTPLHYQYYMVNGAAIPSNNPTNPKFKMAIETWRHLPLAVTKILGPKLVKAFP